MKNIFGIFAIVVIIVAAMACSSDDTTKANAVVDEANKFVAAANESVVKGGKLGDEFDQKVSAIKSKSDLTDARDLGKDLMKEYDSMVDNFKKAGDKFDEVSKLKLKDKHKEYLETKAKEMKLRSDYAAEMKKIPQALIDTDSKSEFTDKVTKLVAKVKTMTSDAQDLSDKGDKLVKENPDIMQQPK